MNKNKVIVILVIIIVALLVSASVLYSMLEKTFDSNQLVTEATEEATSETYKEEHNSSLAPDFTVYDADGNEAKLSDFFGKPIVLNFWASWCGPCKREMPDFNEKYLETREDVTFLMVNMTGGRETLDTAKAFISEQGYSFPVLYDIDESAALTYSVYSLPTTYFIDADGNLVTKAVGAINAETLQRGIDMITK